MLNEPLIICCSGASVPYDNGIPVELKNVIENNYSIGINYFNLYGCETTWLTFCDYTFYKGNLEYLKNRPLIIGKYDAQLVKKNDNCVMSNTLLIPSSKTYFGVDSWEVSKKLCTVCKTKFPRAERKCPNCKYQYAVPIGIYNSHLSSLFALTLGIALGFKKIYLLGSDCTQVNGKTHFYQHLITDYKKYSGVGVKNGGFNTATYNNVSNLNDRWFLPYTEEEGVKIYNVSPESAVTVFEKIDYTTFYNKVGVRSVNQDEARSEIRNEIIKKVS